MNMHPKNNAIVGFRDFIWNTRVETWKILPEVFKLDAISILAIPTQT